jgi:hypothetical protein
MMVAINSSQKENTSIIQNNLSYSLDFFFLFNIKNIPIIRVVTNGKP